MSAKPVKLQDASTAGGVRIARRRIVTASLKQCLSLDVNIACFDICPRAGLLASCTGKVLYLWSMDKFVVVHKFGRTSGSIHKGDIVCCVFENSGQYVATCGEDRKVVVWNLKLRRAEKTFEAAKGKVHHVAFSEDGSIIFSGAADGVVTVRNWAAEKVLHTFMCHEASVRTFALSSKNQDRVVVGLSNGGIKAWDIAEMRMIDHVSSDPVWDGKKAEPHASAHMHHTGGILSCSISRNMRLLCTTSLDFTAKLWNVWSYARQTPEVALRKQAISATQSRLEGQISVVNTVIDDEERCKTAREVMLGEVDVQEPYHADLRHTLRHEAPVFCCGFTRESDMVVTGSMDCTCRIWSTRLGNLLFQINMPSAVTHLRLSNSNELFCCCANRLLILDIEAHTKEDDVPDYWREKADEDLQRIEEAYEKAVASQRAQQAATMAAGEAGKKEELPETKAAAEKPAVSFAERPETTKVTLEELRQLLAHGAILPSFIDTLLDQHKDIDRAQLRENMARHDVQPRQFLRLLLNSQFRPEDLLSAVAAKNRADLLFNLIRQGGNVNGYMRDVGYRPVDPQYAAKTAVVLNARDYHAFDASSSAPVSGAQRWVGTAEARDVASRGSRGLPDVITGGIGTSQAEDADDWEYVEEEIPEYLRQGSHREGEVLHFIPSEHFKIAKDIRAEREVKPVFLRKMIFGGEFQKFPNFGTPDIADTTPRVPVRAMPREGVRFNEFSAVRNDARRPRPIYNPRQAQLAMRRQETAADIGIWSYKTAPRPPPKSGRGRRLGMRLARRAEELERRHLEGLESGRPLGQEGGPISSSRELFKPEKYVHVRGLNINFEDLGGGTLLGRPRGVLTKGHIYAQPMLLRQNRAKDVQTQFITGQGVPLLERKPIFQG